MSIRKRTWRTAGGEEREAWIVDYTDQRGTRHLKTFERKKDAEAWAATTKVEIIKGVHTAASASITVTEAGRRWIAACEAAGLEPSTLAQYRSHLKHHIDVLLGATRLALLTVPTCADFQAKLLKGGRSWPLTRKIMASLGSLVAQAQVEGRVAHNAVQEFLRSRRRSSEQRVEDRQRGKLRVGEDIPTPAELREILKPEHAGRWGPILMTAALTGMRASELRGLTWDNVDFKNSVIRVVQRADCYQTIGDPKSRAGHRDIPLTPRLALMLREQKLACAKGDKGLCFPDMRGEIQWYNTISDGFAAAQVSAKVVKDGEAKYGGRLHALRHFFASWCISRKVDGGLELPAKVVSERLGHSSIAITLNTYGHLFPRGDDSAALAEGEAALLS
jgi:integrase